MQGVFEKIIKKVKENAYMVVQKNNSKELGMTLCGFEQVINEVSAEYNNGWIACTDRLPTREEYQRGNGRFLVTDGNRTYEAEFDIYESHTFGKSRMATDWFVTDKCVTHWQNEPLPPEYQPKGE